MTTSIATAYSTVSTTGRSPTRSARTSPRRSSSSTRWRAWAGWRQGGGPCRRPAPHRCCRRARHGHDRGALHRRLRRRHASPSPRATTCSPRTPTSPGRWAWAEAGRRRCFFDGPGDGRRAGLDQSVEGAFDLLGEDEPGVSRATGRSVSSAVATSSGVARPANPAPARSANSLTRSSAQRASRRRRRSRASPRSPRRRCPHRGARSAMLQEPGLGTPTTCRRRPAVRGSRLRSSRLSESRAGDRRGASPSSPVVEDAAADRSDHGPAASRRGRASRPPRARPWPCARAGRGWCESVRPRSCSSATSRSRSRCSAW